MLIYAKFDLLNFAVRPLGGCSFAPPPEQAEQHQAHRETRQCRRFRNAVRIRTAGLGDAVAANIVDRAGAGEGYDHRARPDAVAIAEAQETDAAVTDFRQRDDGRVDDVVAEIVEEPNLAAGFLGIENMHAQKDDRFAEVEPQLAAIGLVVGLVANIGRIFAAPRPSVLARLDDQNIAVSVVRDRIAVQIRAGGRKRVFQIAVTGIHRRTVEPDRKVDLFATVAVGFGADRNIDAGVRDLLLQKISERLQAAVRETDMIARIGGDEFALLLPSAETVDQATSISEEFLEVLFEPFELAGLTLEIGGSIGIAMYPQHGDDAASLVKSADVSMYVAKQAQSGFAVYDEEKDQNSVRYLTLTGDLRRAIQEGQLTLFYQPKINLKQNRIVAVEALIRWIHPEHGFIPPDDFIDKAEQTGVIGDMTEWVLNTAVAQAAAWRERGLEIDMAVNISARLLNDFEIVEMVDQSLRKWQIPPESLILEVTENALMDDPAKAMEVITALAALRSRISIDDFGTGYSSLGYLKDLPANEMKIDKCFVQSMHESESDATIVQSTVGLAHGLGLKVVAEGIETEEHCRELAAIDCDVGQGYLFSKPLPIEEFEFWLISSPWGLGDDTSGQVDQNPAAAAM